MSVQNRHELFVHELQDVYDAEHRFEEALGEMATQVENEALRDGLSDHQAETRTQIERLEQVFDSIGAEAERENCEATEGIVEEHEDFVADEDPSQEVLDRFAVISAQKSERYEVTAYENLLQLAEKGGHDTAADLLRETLEEERETFEELQDIAEEFDYESIAA